MIIDGKKLAAEHEILLKEKIQRLGISPKVVSILIGENPASVLYSNLKQKKAKQLGINFELKRFPEDITFNEVVSEIKNLNNNPEISGIMAQLPLPEKFLGEHLTDELLQEILPEKDIDGLTGKGFVPQATVKGIFSILESEKVGLKTSRIVVVGAKGMVGSGLMKAFSDYYDTSMYQSNVRGVDMEVENLCQETKKADILISAVGKRNLITADCVKEGSVVIDVGGDVDFENVKDKASRITPHKGGVGPMTVISLMENTVEVSSRLRSNNII